MGDKMHSKESSLSVWFISNIRSEKKTAAQFDLLAFLPFFFSSLLQIFFCTFFFAYFAFAFLFVLISRVAKYLPQQELGHDAPWRCGLKSPFLICILV